MPLLLCDWWIATTGFTSNAGALMQLMDCYSMVCLIMPLLSCSWWITATGFTANARVIDGLPIHRLLLMSLLSWDWWIAAIHYLSSSYSHWSIIRSNIQYNLIFEVSKSHDQIMFVIFLWHCSSNPSIHKGSGISSKLPDCLWYWWIAATWYAANVTVIMQLMVCCSMYAANTTALMRLMDSMVHC